MSYFEEQINSDDIALELEQLLESISGWMEANDFHTQLSRQRFEKIQSLLADKQRNILFLAEFSRGKSELINTTIFGSSGKRYLPSTPGRTTRCTTELEYDPEQLSSIRLLPTLGPLKIQRQPISMLKKQPELWQRTPFSVSDPDLVIKALRQISETALVTPAIAKELGFLKSLDESELAKIDMIGNKVSVPKYRHAIINFPHPLLKQGLSIIDTPGLNALGIEPELTFQALESANAIVFVLSADTGITKSELEAWNDHVKKGTANNVLVVINKIDTLWDELKTRTEIEKQLKIQVSDVARILEVPLTRIFPVSAQKSLVGRRKNNLKLIEASGIKKYEEALADTINYTNRKGIIDRARIELEPTLNAIQRVLEQRRQSTHRQMQAITKHHNTQSKIAGDNISIVQKDRQKLAIVSEKLNLIRVDLKVDYERFVNKLDIFELDKLIAQYRYEISNQLTTPGLQREMNFFQSQAVEQFKEALRHVRSLESKLSGLYKFAGKILDTKGLKPRKIHPKVYLKALKQHEEKHQQYTEGLTLMMTEQKALRDRYYASVMVKLRQLYVQTRDDVDLWCRSVLVPLELELKERESLLKKRLLTLQRIRDDNLNLQDELRVMQSRNSRHKQHQKALKHFMRRLNELSEQNRPDMNNVIELHQHIAAG